MNHINYIRLSSYDLYHNFHLFSENLSFQNGIRLNNAGIYIFKEFIIKDSSFDITDIAIDECDTLWIIDRSRDKILTYNRLYGEINEAGCKNGLLPLKLYSPTGIAIDKDTIYISGFNKIQNKSRIIALARSNLQIRWICDSDDKGNHFTEITDLVIDLNNLYALDKGNKQAIIIRRSGEIAGFIKDNTLSEPTDITVDEKGVIYILDGSKIFLFKENTLSEVINTTLHLKGISVSREAQIFAGEPDTFDSKKTIYKVMHDGSTIPIWSYRDATRRLINDSRGNLYIIDSKGKSIAFLEYSIVNTKDKEEHFKGVFISKAIDSNEDNIRWHRFLIDGEFVKGTQLEFSYFTSDSLMPDNEIISMPENRWNKCLSEKSGIQEENKRDALFLKNINGRYLWFKLVLFGDEKLTPIIKMLTLFFPRLTLLDYLPANYQENPKAKDFLERFLSIFDSLIYEVDFEIKHLTRFFDAEGTPSEFLSWLGTWLSICTDANWSEEKTRAFIKKAIHFYKMRGTRKGLEEILELFTGYKPFIFENINIDSSYSTKCADKWDSLHEENSIYLPSDKSKVKTIDGENISLKEALFGKERFCFFVLLPSQALKNQKTETIKKIIDEHKPAHTCYGLKVLEQWFYLDMHTYLGMNTLLNEPIFILGESSVIGRDTILKDTEDAGQVKIKARLGIDTKLT